MQSGYKPYKWHDHRDFDAIKSFGATAPAQFPPTLNVDAGIWQPNQNAPQTIAVTGQDTLTLPALPYGCTDYTQTDLCMDEDLKLLNPLDLENITHANANGGADIKVSLKAAIQAFGRTAYFNIKRAQPLDWYDSLRLVMLSTPEEKRAVSIGIPWYQSFERVDASGILPTPDYANESYSWHNAAVKGWTPNGLIIKSWQGSQYGDNGYCYMPRAVVNKLLDIPGTCAFTISKIAPAEIQTVSLPFIEWFVSVIRNLFSFNTMPQNEPVAPIEAPAPSTPVHVSRITTWAKAIEANEGADPKLNNPGNLKLATLTASWGATKGRQAADGGYLCQFPTYQQGFQALCNFLTLGAENQLLAFHKARTLQAFTVVYAGNPPQPYIDRIAHSLGVPLTIDVAELL